MGNKVDNWINRLKNHPILSILIFIAIVLIALVDFADLITQNYSSFRPELSVSFEYHSLNILQQLKEKVRTQYARDYKGFDIWGIPGGDTGIIQLRYKLSLVNNSAEVGTIKIRSRLKDQYDGWVDEVKFMNYPAKASKFYQANSGRELIIQVPEFFKGEKLEFEYVVLLTDSRALLNSDDRETYCTGCILFKTDSRQNLFIPGMLEVQITCDNCSRSFKIKEDYFLVPFRFG